MTHHSRALRWQHDCMNMVGSLEAIINASAKGLREAEGVAKKLRRRLGIFDSKGKPRGLPAIFRGLYKGKTNVNC